MSNPSSIGLGDVLALVDRTTRSLDGDFDVATACVPAGSLGRSGLLFFKPEILALDFLGLQEAIQYLWKAAQEFEVSIRTAHVISGRHALRQRFVQKNYAVIHQNATLMPDDDLPIEVCHGLSSSGWRWPVLGARRALGPGRSADDLIDLWRTGLDDIKKLGEDCYGLPIVAGGRKFVLLNGFYPFQLQKYREPNAKIIAFTFDTNRPFDWLKEFFQGDADQRIAAKGSVRLFLSGLVERLGAPEIWVSQNGLHMSANTAQGTAELEIFEACFGEALHRSCSYR